MVEGAIYIRASGAGFVVAVEPPRDGIAPAEFGDHRAAFGFASGLRLTQRLPIKDKTGQGRQALAGASEVLRRAR